MSVEFDEPVNLGTPVVNARQWTTGLAPNTRGGWNFITQIYNYPTSDPTEWVVVDLEAGTHTVDLGTTGQQANTNFQIDSALQASGQTRASNGRIFFPLGSTDTHVNAAYYDPTDERVHFFSADCPSGDRNSVAFSMVFNHAGDTIYGGTQAVIGDDPVVFSIDPATLTITIIGVVGVAASANPKYAYYLARDTGNNWLYAAVGQEKWEIVKIDVTTGTQTILLTTGGVGTQAVQFDALADGWRCTVVDNGVSTYYWMADGALSAYPGSGAPPGGSRLVTPYSNPLVSPPDIDYQLGAGYVAWRENGATRAKEVITYPVSYKQPVAIESLTALPEGGVLGSCEQYNGFWKLNPDTDEMTWFGPGTLAPLSQAVATRTGRRLWMSGYPNGLLYDYDPHLGWDPVNSFNPVSVGDFHATAGIKYAYQLGVANNGRLYCVGRRERDGTGSGIGYYEGGTFTGTTTGLTNYLARGMVLLDKPARLVYAGETIDASDAEVIVYDADLAELDRHVIRAGLSNAGRLFPTRERNVVLGVSDDGQLAYRLDVTTGNVTSVALGAAVGPVAMDDDLVVWAVIGGILTAINPTTLARRPVVDLSELGVLVAMVWDGPDLYIAGGTAGETLYRLHSFETQNYYDGAQPTPFRFPPEDREY